MATNVNITEPPEFLRDYYAALAERGMNLGNLGFTPYSQDKVAPWNEQQDAASQMIQQRALSGSPAMNQAGDWYSNMLAGNNQVANTSVPGQVDPITNQYLGAQSQGVAPSGQIGMVNYALGPSGINSGGEIREVGAAGQIGAVNAAMGPQSIQGVGDITSLSAPGSIGQAGVYTGPSSIATGGTATAGRNAYLGMNNPYLNQAIQDAQGDVSSAIGSRFNNGAFGGTAHQQTLARELGRVSNNMRMQDYSAQQGLSESDVARQLATQQYNIGNQNQLNQYNANLDFQNAGIQNQMGLANAGLRGQDISNQMTTDQANAGIQGQNLARGLGTQQFNANLGFQNAGIQNQMGLSNAGLQGQNIQNQMATNQQNTSIQGQNIGNQNSMNQFNANLGFQNAGIQNQMGLSNAGLQGQNISNQNYANQFNANLGAADLSRNAGLASTLGQSNANLGLSNIQNQMNTNQFNAGLQGQNIGRQQSAMSFAPTLAANDYADASAMMGLGNQIQGNNQNIANANYAEFMRQQAYPGQQLQYMAQGLSPSAGAFSNQTTTGDTSGSTSANMLAGGALGYAGSNALNFENPWLAATGGAVIGGLL